MANSIQDSQSVSPIYANTVGAEAASETAETVSSFVVPVLELSAEQDLAGKDIKVIDFERFSPEVFQCILTFLEFKDLFNFPLVSEGWRSHAAVIKLVLKQDLFIYAKKMIVQLKSSFVPSEFGDFAIDKTQRPCEMYEQIVRFFQNYICSIDISDLDICILREIQKNCGLKTPTFFKGLISYLIINKLLDAAIMGALQGRIEAGELTLEISTNMNDLLSCGEFSMAIALIGNAKSKLVSSQLEDWAKNWVFQGFVFLVFPLISTAIKMKIKNLEKTHAFTELLIEAAGDYHRGQIARLRASLYAKCQSEMRSDKALEFASKIHPSIERFRAYNLILRDVTLHSVETAFNFCSNVEDNLLKLTLLKHCYKRLSNENNAALKKKTLEILGSIDVDEIRNDESKWLLHAYICDFLVIQISYENILDLSGFSYVTEQVRILGYPPDYPGPNKDVAAALDSISDKLKILSGFKD